MNDSASFSAIGWSASGVLPCDALPAGALEHLLAGFGLNVRWLAAGQPIPGTYWGEPEAGLIADTLHVRPDTPVHSALHEGCHWICIDPARRPQLHTVVPGSQAEENATCYLQILLADCVPGMGRARMCRDMDLWGYSFRLGSALAWFEGDADDARSWLQARGILSAAGTIASI